MRVRWLKLRRKLNSNYAYNDDWNEAISLFETRINERYIRIIKELIGLQYFEGEGFPIVTIQCSLIETFAAFRKGLIHNPRYNEGTDPSYQYFDSRKLFVDFLFDCKYFDNHFYSVNGDGKKEKNKPYNAEKFYASVRSSLVHETRTKNQWKIRVKKSCDDGVFIEKIGNDFILYRTVFQRQIENYFIDYLAELREPTNDNLRRLFARKLDHLLEFKNKKGYEWWNE
jgi:hypothetical protein